MGSGLLQHTNQSFHLSPTLRQQGSAECAIAVVVVKIIPFDRHLASSGVDLEVPDDPAATSVAAHAAVRLAAAEVCATVTVASANEVDGQGDGATAPVNVEAIVPTIVVLGTEVVGHAYAVAVGVHNAENSVTAAVPTYQMAVL